MGVTGPGPGPVPVPSASGHVSGGQRLLLVGMMGVGKSTVARALAEVLGWPLLDTDRAVEQRRGRTVAEIFTEEGEECFRAEEALALQAMARLGGRIVVSVGGGAVKSEANRQVLRVAGTVVWLRASARVLAARVGTGRGRPLLAGAEDRVEAALARLAQQRAPLYEEVADVVLDVDGLSPNEVARRIIAGLGLATATAAGGRPRPRGRPPYVK